MYTETPTTMLLSGTFFTTIGIAHANIYCHCEFVVKNRFSGRVQYHNQDVGDRHQAEEKEEHGFKQGHVPLCRRIEYIFVLK